MTVIKKEKKGNVTVYTVKKNFDDEKMEKSNRYRDLTFEE